MTGFRAKSNLLSREEEERRRRRRKKKKKEKRRAQRATRERERKREKERERDENEILAFAEVFREVKRFGDSGGDGDEDEARLPLFPCSCKKEWVRAGANPRVPRSRGVRGH